MKHQPCLEALEARRLLSDGLLTSRLPFKAVPAVDHDNPVITWNAVALEATRQSRVSPPVASRDLAIVQVSVYDAVNAIHRTGPSYRVRVMAPEGASAAAAAIGAADEALVALFPGQTSLFDAALAKSLAGLRPSHGTTQGLAVGKKVADKELALRSNDRSSAGSSYTPSDQVGLWRPTPPAYAQAMLPGWGRVTPFMLKSGSQFRPSGPPPLASAAYATALNEVKAIGSANSLTRTPDQTQIALFWADGSGTETPPGHWNRIAERVALQRHDSLTKDARVFALLDTAMADAAIACWDTKFAYNLWRPVTAIRLADTDNNPATGADPSWTPLLTTPPFPSYDSGHSTFSAAAAVVLSSIYGPKTRFRTTSDTLPGVTRKFSSFWAAASEAGASRVYGGIHYQFDNQAGLSLGREIGRYVIMHRFQE
jgi:membrane-associated phospholipid phosphatase